MLLWSSVEFIAMLCELQIANWTAGNICQVYHHLRSPQIIQRGAHKCFVIVIALLKWVVWVAESQLTSKVICGRRTWCSLLPCCLYSPKWMIFWRNWTAFDHLPLFWENILRFYIAFLSAPNLQWPFFYRKSQQNSKQIWLCLSLFNLNQLKTILLMEHICIFPNSVKIHQFWGLVGATPPWSRQASGAFPHPTPTHPPFQANILVYNVTGEARLPQASFKCTCENLTTAISHTYKLVSSSLMLSVGWSNCSNYKDEA